MDAPLLIRNPSCGEFDVKQICARGQSCSSAWPTLLRHSLESGFLSTRFATQLTRLIPSPIDSYRWGTCEKIYCAEHISYKVYEHGEGGSQLPLERAEKDLVQYKLVARICTNAETPGASIIQQECVWWQLVIARLGVSISDSSIGTYKAKDECDCISFLFNDNLDSLCLRAVWREQTRSEKLVNLPGVL